MVFLVIADTNIIYIIKRSLRRKAEALYLVFIEVSLREMRVISDEIL